MTSAVLRWVRPHLNENARRQALAMISTAEFERFEGTPAHQRDSFLAGRLVLRRLAAELTGLEPAEVPLSATCPDCGGPHGRPVLVDSDLHLSLSHRNDAVVAAASWGQPVGVDVESPGSTDSLSAIAALTGEASIQRWMRIEAVLKADGRGLRVDPNAVSLETVGDRLQGSVAGASTRYQLDEVELAPDLIVAVAVAL